MPEIHGNTEGIRKTVLDELAMLYDVQLEPGQFMPQDLLQSLCGYSASMNREIAVYITRYGEIADVFIGRADSIDLPDLRLRRGERRLSMVRCVHTHPRATGELSDVDVSALLSMRFDAMCAVGVSEDGRPTSVQCAFLDAESEGHVRRTELISARRLPQEEWLAEIERTDAAYRAANPATRTGRERAVLVGIESEESLDELEELAKTAGAETVLRVLQKRPKPDPVYCVGKGKAEELSLRCQAAQADLVIFDEELSGVMQKNLEETLRLKVVDRTALILDIFAARASTREGKLQVEMAQLRYRSQRLLGQGLVLSRLAGGIGTRGPGESKLEVNRRRIRERLTDLERELEQIERQRGLRRQSREKNGVPIVALVGYTNAGKSTLFNRLTGADVYVENQLFATLDSVSRPIELPHGGKALLVDTVGFIRKLPHELVKAFRATLEEARLADVLVLVLDGADAQMEGRRRTVEEVLDSLGATEAPRVEAVNKCDLIAPEAQSLPGALYISASTGENVEKLLLRVESELEAGAQEVRLLIPFSRYALVSRLHAMGGVLEQRHSEEGVEIRMRITPQNVKFACREGAKVLGGEKM
ncbi:MAG TPA: GTPase HflX [Candidatus Limiplasma pullistercoris]|nr:GTPase HflX [Candidatus Limiplasma pullistercoris]